MLTQGYEADGWLGLLLGTSMWYAFYGDALSSGSVFDGRMDALCREIGVRGRADAAVVPEAALGSAAESATLAAGDNTPLALELRAMKLSVLRKRAVSCGVSDAELEVADDASDIKAEIVKLIVARELAATGGLESARGELMATMVSVLRKRALAAGVNPEAIEMADDAADIKAALVELLLAAQATEIDGERGR
jgi:hypothetical protein